MRRLTLCVLCFLCGLGGCRRREEPPAPLVASVNGTIAVAGLSTPVRVVRDTSGIPHLYAQSQHDLFFAQGFVQAQDRLFQMDLWRRSVKGRLSEVLGGNFVERDAMTRRIQYRGDPQVEWASYGPDTKAIAEAFVAGVNAWVALARERPPEEFVLAGWKPEAWAPEDLLNRTDAFVASSGALDEIFRARLVAAVGARRAAALLPGAPIEVPAGLDPATIHPIVGEVIRRAGAPPFFLGLAGPVASSPPRSDESRRGAPGNAAREGGPSDASPEPSTRIDHPSRRYLIHLVAPGWNLAGIAAPWLPGVVAGHNDRIAWSIEPIDADVQDVFIERLNPSNPHQVDDNGRWIDTHIVTEEIWIRGNQKPFVFQAEHAPHGVVIASDRARNLAFALRWSGTEPGGAGELAALALGRARSWSEFRDALARWKMPARRFTYIDVDGQQRVRTAALVPVRRGWQGTLPAPAWSGKNEWTAWVPLDALPQQPAADAVAALTRGSADRLDALLKKIATAVSVTEQRALMVAALADALPAESPGAVLFAHPLGINAASRRRFNIGPLSPLAGAGAPVALSFDVSDWDRSQGMNAPGQSESPASPYFANLAPRWAAGERVTLPFSDAAVHANAASTLTLTPRN